MILAWALLAACYLGFALVVGVLTHIDNQASPAFLPRPSPWLRGALWFPVMLIGIVMVLWDLGTLPFRNRRFGP